ncbi:MAG: hypothetical protein WC889_13300 [Myxococcota bacterium]|jgi:hypothetical protein
MVIKLFWHFKGVLDLYRKWLFLVTEVRMMTRAQIMNTLKRLPTPERISIIEDLLQTFKAELGGEDHEAEKRRMAAAAKELMKDYAEDGDLTLFTSLDAEDFHAQG